MTEKVDQEHMPNNTPILRWDGAAGSSRVWDSLQGVGTHSYEADLRAPQLPRLTFKGPRVMV